LATKGWEVYGFDHSENQIRKAKEFAAQNNVKVHAITMDVVKQQDDILKNYSADLVNVSRFLDRNQMEFIRNIIRPGGFIVYHTFMAGCSKPRNPKFKLEEGELAKIFSDFQILEDKVITISDGRRLSYFMARKNTKLVTDATYL